MMKHCVNVSVRKLYPALLLSLLLSGAALGSQHKSSSSSSNRVTTVEFCDLTEHPERYVNKLVRVKANYIVWWESSYLYSDSCQKGEHSIHNALDCPGGGSCTDCNRLPLECEKIGKQISKALEPYMRDSGDRYHTMTAYRVSAIYIGRLVGPGKYGHLDSFRYEFRIRRVEKAMAIPDNVPW